jgi:hypothetical protein
VGHGTLSVGFADYRSPAPLLAALTIRAQSKWRARGCKMPDEQKTVKVRILVAVDCSGNWTSHGHSGESDTAMKDWIDIDNLEYGEVYHWVEADVPLPVEIGPAIAGVTHAAKR